MAANPLEGVAQLTKQLREIAKLDDGKALRSAVRAGMRPALKRAQQLIPKGENAHKTYKGRLVAPGFASRNLRVITYLSADKQKAGAVLSVRSEAFYAVQFVELGTSKRAAQPWLRPAFESTQQQQQTAIKAALVRILRKAQRKK